MMRAGTVLLLLATVAWARDCPFCEESMVRVPVRQVVHFFCSSCSCTVYANRKGPATASVRVRGGRRTFLLLDKDTVSRRHMEDLEPYPTEERRVWPGHPVTTPGHPVSRPGHPVSRPRHPVSLPGHAVKRPAHPLKRPAHSVKRPAHAVKRPAHSVKRPAHSVKRPAHAVKRPAHPVSRPGHAVQRPSHPVSRPGRILTSVPALPRRTDGPALLLAPRKWSPPVRRSAPRR
jgi:hypothetical protein